MAKTPKPTGKASKPDLKPLDEHLAALLNPALILRASTPLMQPLQKSDHGGAVGMGRVGGETALPPSVWVSSTVTTSFLMSAFMSW